MSFDSGIWLREVAENVERLTIEQLLGLHELVVGPLCPATKRAASSKLPSHRPPCRTRTLSLSTRSIRDSGKGERAGGRRFSSRLPRDGTSPCPITGAHGVARVPCNPDVPRVRDLVVQCPPRVSGSQIFRQKCH